MNKKIIIHAGSQKTGSSTIQQYLQDTPIPGYDFISVTRDGNSSNPLLSAFCTSNWYYDYKNINVPPERRTSNPLAIKLIESIKNNTSPNLIISGESISRMNEESLDKLKRFLLDQDLIPNILMYVRDPYECASSMFQQFLKPPPPIWLKSLCVDGLVSLEDLIVHSMPKYEVIIPRIYSVFGKESVRLLPFGRSLGNSSNLISHFLNAINPHLALDSSTNQSIVYNASMSRFLVKLLWTEGISSNWTLNTISLPQRAKAIDFLKRNANSGDRFKFSKQCLASVIRPLEIQYLDLFSSHFDIGDVEFGRYYNGNDFDISSVSDLSEFNEQEFDTLGQLSSRLGSDFDSGNLARCCQGIMAKIYAMFGKV